MKNFRTALVGLAFIGAGLVIVLSNMGIIDYVVRRIILSWPMAVIAVGMLVLADKNWKGAAVLLTVGVFFLLPRIPSLGISPSFIHNFWPFMLVLVGLIILSSAFTGGSDHSDSGRDGYGRHDRHYGHGRSERLRHGSIDRTFSSDTYSSDGYIDQSFCFTGSDQTFVAPVFRGGRISTVFGGTNLDLTKTSLPEDQDVELVVKAVFGGASIMVPPDWRVELRTSSFLGGGSDSRPHSVERNSAHKLIVRIESVFGGVEVR